MVTQDTKKKRGFWGRLKGKKASPTKEIPQPAPTTPSKPLPTQPAIQSPTIVYKSPQPPPEKKLTTSPQSPVAKKAQLKTSWLARSRLFRKICDTAFIATDTDGSGCVDENELYAGLLLIHLKLGLYAGPAACKPIDRERCRNVFHKMDVDESGSLDKEEFAQVMMVLFSNIIFRVMAQWSLTLMIVPLIARHVLYGIIWLHVQALAFIWTLDQHSDLAYRVETTIEGTAEWALQHLPGSFLLIYDEILSFISRIPEGVWSTIPLTLISTLLSMLAVPWCIFKIDDFFQYLADRKASKNRISI